MNLTIRFFIICLSFLSMASVGFGNPICKKVFSKNQKLNLEVKKVGPGPVAEYIDPGAVVLSAFFPNQYLLSMHREIISHLPEHVRALILLPKREKKDPQGNQVTTDMYEEEFQDLLKEKKVEFVFVPLKKDYDIYQHGNWTRDFLSQFAIDKDGQILFMNFKYSRKDADNTDDVVQPILAKEIEKATGRKVKTMDIPVYFEWGNIASDGTGHVFISERVIKNNQALGLTTNEILSWFKKLFGQEVTAHIIKDISSESTGHMDMYMKFLDGQNVLVAKAPEEFHEWNEPLDLLAKNLKSIGKTVTRVDIAVDANEIKLVEKLSKSDRLEALKKIPFRSYTNSLVTQDVAQVPRYDSDLDNLKKFDSEALKIYQDVFGFKTFQVGSQYSIVDGGSIHCLSSVIPNFTEIIKKISK